MRLLGIDLGEKRTGLAISDETALIASPLKTIDSSDLIKELKTIISNKKITGIVIGFPKNMNNTIGKSAEEALNIKALIKKEFDIKVYLQDERRTTILAEEYMIKNETKKRKKKKKVDGIAAAIILQNFLDRGERNGKNDI